MAQSNDKLDRLAEAIAGIVNQGAVNITVQEGDTYTIPAGFHNGSGTVSGVGGGGNNAINRMMEDGIEGVDSIAVNTDLQVLDESNASYKIQIGKKLTSGLGAGANPEVGEKSAIEDLAELEELVDGYKLVFITCGMGGGTGSGATPIIAKCCKEKGILTVAIVTKPFEYEGEPKKEIADKAIEKLRENVDTLIIIPNEKLLDVYSDLTFDDAFKRADQVLNYAVKGTLNPVNAIPLDTYIALRYYIHRSAIYRSGI